MRRLLWLGAGLYLGAWVLTAFLPLDPTDLDVFFWPSAREALQGHPLLVYQPGGHDLYPNANGPLGLVPLVLAGLPLQAFHWLGDIHLRRLLALPFGALFIVLMAREGVRLIEAERGTELAGTSRLLAYAALTLPPPMWQSVAGYGHIEQPMAAWLILAAIRRLRAGREPAGGALLGLAILARSTSALFLAPVALWLWRRGRVAGAGSTLVVAIVSVGVGLAPFLLADRADVVHSLASYRAALPVGAGSFWTALAGTSWEAVGQRWDGVMVGVTAVALSLFAVGRRDFWGAMLVTAISFPLFAKTVWAYYLFEVYVMSVIWVATSGRRRLVVVLLPAAVAGLGLLAELGSIPEQARGVVVAEGLAMGASLVLLVGAVLATRIRA